MKGIVFNVLEAVVCEEHGEDTWDALLSAAGVEGIYTSMETYPDAELMAIVGAASEALGLPPSDVVRWFGQRAIPHFKALYPVFFEGHVDTAAFLGTLNDIIHPEVRKVYPGASVPEFTLSQGQDGKLIVEYHSSKRLCALAMGLIEGSAPIFGQAATVNETACVHEGAETCIFECGFETA